MHGTEKNKKIKFFEIDCNDLDAMSKAIKGCDIVYHCAATAHEGLSVFSPNVITKNIFQASVSTITASIQNNVKRFIFCSSMARYGDQTPPFTENLDKKPVDAKRNQLASTTDSSTWASFSQAESLYHQKRPYLGLGFVFSSDDPLLGIDLDNCRHTESGQIEDWAQQLIDCCQTYSEVSPSGSGVKLFMQGKMPGNRHKSQYQTGAVEMYDCKRFFTVPGQP